MRSVFLAGTCLVTVFSLEAGEFPPVPSSYGPRMHLAATDAGTLSITWEAGDKRQGLLTLNAQTDAVIERLALRAESGGEMTIASKLAPVFTLTEGSRVAPNGRPPEMSAWNVFFDNPAKRPFETHTSNFAPANIRVEHEADARMTVRFSGVTVGSFTGELAISVYSGTPLIQVEAIVATQRDMVAYVYEAGVKGPYAQIDYLDTEGQWQSQSAEQADAYRQVAVKHRTVIGKSGAGSLALFPPPHQFFFPVDSTDNNRTVWRRKDAFGIRQDPKGGGNFVPWCNAPPDTKQHLGFFLLPGLGSKQDTLNEALRFTHQDAFEQLPGLTTYTSHYHMAIAVAAMERAQKGLAPSTPDYVKMFKELGVRIVHLAEFHGDGHSRDPGPQRLPEMKSMFDECRRLSDGDLLLLPGEEGNEYLGIRRINAHPGHWMRLFPKPVYWTMVRPEGTPFSEDLPPFGRVYHVGSTEDMFRLLQEEHGLAWTAHPRIKASSWAPDAFRAEVFYKSAQWLGAAFKAMPADLSREKLGERGLDLLSDMANWGDHKYLPGEVDVFKLNHTHELYGHMNINYLRLPKAPRYEDGWQSVLDALRAGAFFTTTGEVLIRSFTLGGKQSGEALSLTKDASNELTLNVTWTFPLAFAEVVTGDGKDVFRERLPLTDTEAFGTRTLTLKPNLKDRKWLRVEVWDIARNGAYTQPVWLE